CALLGSLYKAAYVCSRSALSLADALFAQFQEARSWFSFEPLVKVLSTPPSGSLMLGIPAFGSVSKVTSWALGKPAIGAIPVALVRPLKPVAVASPCQSSPVCGEDVGQVAFGGFKTGGVPAVQTSLSSWKVLRRLGSQRLSSVSNDGRNFSRSRCFL